MFAHASAGLAFTAGAASLVFALGAFAQAKVAHSDAEFLQRAAADGIAEVELGKLAEQKALRDEVKQFGTRMVKDHGQANDELRAIAGAKGVALPAEMDRKHRKAMEKLQKVLGPDFDREYMDLMAADHKKDLKEFRKKAKSGKDIEIRNFAAKTVPTLQEHLDSALATRDIAAAPKRTGKRETGSTRK